MTYEAEDIGDEETSYTRGIQDCLSKLLGAVAFCIVHSMLPLPKRDVSDHWRICVTIIKTFTLKKFYCHQRAM